jgi:D-arabinose 1-dehydrogenase-like Zn-dependent alcohol dehydrogenase
MPGLPKTFKALQAAEVKAELKLADVELVEPKEGEILIKVEACGVCHSDHAVLSGDFGPLAHPNLILGHEIVGHVVAVGPGEKKWKVGQRVGGGWHGGHDGVCRSCNRGVFQCCENEAVNGVSRDGGYGQYATLRTEATVKVPDGMDAAAAAPLLCAGVTVFNGIRQMNIIAGGTVAIQGLGGLGHLALQYSRKMGYRTVALSRDDSKKDFATKLGATDYLDGSKGDAGEELQKLGGADLIVVTAPNPKIIAGLVGGLAPLGKLLILAPVGDVTVNTVPMILKGQSVHGWPSGHALDSEEAIAFAQTQGVECMVEKFPLSKWKDAFEAMVTSKVRFRAVLMMEE